MSQVLTVFGATGKQGGSVIKGVQAHSTLSKQYKIRGITRDPSKPAAQALADMGVEVVQVRTGLGNKWIAANQAPGGSW